MGFLFCFHLWPYVLHILPLSSNAADFFSSTVQVFLSSFFFFFFFFLKDMPSVWAILNHVFAVPGSLFCLPLIAERCAGVKVTLLVIYAYILHFNYTLNTSV